MDNFKFEEEIQYFINLVCKNIQIVKANKPKNMSKEEMIFFNFNIRLDGQEIVVYNQDKDLIYNISVKEIQDYKFEHINKDLVLNVVDLLTKYTNNEITYKNFLQLFSREIQI